MTRWLIWFAVAVTLTGCQCPYAFRALIPPLWHPSGTFLPYYFWDEVGVFEKFTEALTWYVPAADALVVRPGTSTKAFEAKASCAWDGTVLKVTAGLPSGKALN